MPVIQVGQKFTYTDQKRQQHTFDPGQYEVPDEVAENFFVKAHLVGTKPTPMNAAHGPKPWPPYAPNTTKEPATPVAQDLRGTAVSPETPPPSPIGANGGPVAPNNQDDRTLAIKEAERFGPGTESKDAKEADNKSKQTEADAALAKAKEDQAKAQNGGKK